MVRAGATAFTESNNWAAKRYLPVVGSAVREEHWEEDQGLSCP